MSLLIEQARIQQAEVTQILANIEWAKLSLAHLDGLAHNKVVCE